MSVLFESVWARITSLEGERFTQLRGREFSFTCRGEGLYLSTTNQAIFRSQLAEAFALVPLKSTTSIQHLRAPSYVRAILMDPRVRESDW
jgi:hypothetical protein